MPETVTIVLWEKGGGDTMVTKKGLIIAILATFCLTSTLFMILPTKSNSGMGEYDPWVDLNDDGTIDIFDAITLAGAFETSGTPINKTALLLDLQNRVSELENRLSLLEKMHGLPVDWYNGLVGYWKLDEGTGNVTMDSSGNNNSGALMNEPLWTDGKYGKALSFDGEDDYVAVPQSSNLDIVDSVSVTAWVYPKAFPTAGIILSRWYDGTEPDRGVTLHFMQASHLRFGVIDDGNLLDVPFSFEINKWYYLAATWNGSVSKVYVNGIEIGHRSTSGSFTNQNVNLGIGCDLNPFHAYFNGTIDNIMIYNRSLSAEEVMARYLLPPP